MTEQKIHFDFEAMRHATEESDAEAYERLYADDVEMRIVNKNTPPSMSCLFRGKEAITGMLRDVCGREMAHKVESEVIGEERVAFNEDKLGLCKAMSGGEPMHERGVVGHEPGLYFVGLHFLYAMIHGVGGDAERIAKHIASREHRGDA